MRLAFIPHQTTTIKKVLKDLFANAWDSNYENDGNYFEYWVNKVPTWQCANCKRNLAVIADPDELLIKQNNNGTQIRVRFKCIEQPCPICNTPNRLVASPYIKVWREPNPLEDLLSQTTMLILQKLLTNEEQKELGNIKSIIKKDNHWKLDYVQIGGITHEKSLRFCSKIWDKIVLANAIGVARYAGDKKLEKCIKDLFQELAPEAALLRLLRIDAVSKSPKMQESLGRLLRIYGPSKAILGHEASILQMPPDPDIEEDTKCEPKYEPSLTKIPKSLKLEINRELIENIGKSK